MPNTVKPNFFIIGAPKCGTSSMCEYLKHHPEIYFSEPKEPHFFNEDFNNRHTVTESEYSNLFQGATASHKIVAEGSVFYLSSRVAVSNILRYQPKARFCVMLRNPVEMAYAWHSEALRNFGENISDFKKAWAAQERRRQGFDIPPFCKEPKTLLYGDLCKLGAQIQRLLDIIDRERLSVILFEDLKKSPKAAYLKILDFLGLYDDGKEDFPIYNANRRVHSVRVEQIANWASNKWGAIRDRAGFDFKLGIADRMRQINRDYGERPPLDHDFQEELLDFFSADIENLSRLLELDLKSWLEI